MAIGSLDVALNLETAAFSAGVKSAQLSIADLAAGVAAGLGIFTSVQSAMDTFANAIVGGLETAIDEINKFNDVAQELGDTRDTGASLDALALGLQSLGLGAKSSVDVVENFGKVLRDAFAGKTTDATRALEFMGISVQTATGQIRPLNDVLTATVAKMETYRSDADKMAVAQRLFGVSAGDA